MQIGIAFCIDLTGEALVLFEREYGRALDVLRWDKPALFEEQDPHEPFDDDAFVADVLARISNGVVSRVLTMVGAPADADVFLVGPAAGEPAECTRWAVGYSTARVLAKYVRPDWDGGGKAVRVHVWDKDGITFET